jgi:hypothetical protein
MTPQGQKHFRKSCQMTTKNYTKLDFACEMPVKNKTIFSVEPRSTS